MKMSGWQEVIGGWAACSCSWVLALFGVKVVEFDWIGACAGAWVCIWDSSDCFWTWINAGVACTTDC